MSTSVTLNAVSYTIPAQGEGNWGTNVSNYLIALSTGVLQKAGGTFTLTADVDFGATYGLKSVYYKSRNTPSTAGIVRLGNNESVGWRNAANSANLELKVNASNKLEFDGQDIPTLDIGAADTVMQMNAGGTTWEFAKINNANVDDAAAIAYSKLNLATSIVNADIATAAAIARSKLANGTASYVLINSGAGVMSEEQYLDRTRGGTGITSTATFPSSGTVATTSDKLSAFAATSSSELAGVISDETGSGPLVFGTAPTLDKPVLNQADMTQQASATTPASGKSAIYVNSGDAKLHVVDSSGNDVAVGSGSSGRNYLGDWFDAAKDIGTVTNSLTDVVDTSDRTANKTTWGSSNTSLLTIARSASSPLRQSYSYAITEAGSSSGAFIESPLFTLDSLDLGKPVTVSFDVSGNSTSDYYQAYICRYDSNDVLKERIPIAGTASATSPYSARLPVGTTNFQGFFVAGSTSTDQYSLRIVSNNNSADSLKIDSLYVGPQSVVQGAAVCEIPVPTITWTNATGLTPDTSSMKCYRVGKQMHLVGIASFTGTGSDAGALTMALTGYSWSTTGGVAGWMRAEQHSTTYAYNFFVYKSTTSALTFYTQNVGSVASTTLKGTDMSNATSGEYKTFYMDVWLDISTWDDGVTMANRAVEEYASNNSSGTTSDTGTANFSYGVIGSTLNFTTTPAGTSFKRRIRFQSPRQPTDTLVLEVSSGGVYWQPVGGQVGTSGYNIDQLRYDGTNSIGMGISTEDTTATDVYVIFGKYRSGTTTAWDATSGAFYYRVRKVASGASVGYPISTANIVGRTDGVTVGSGYIGERLTASGSATAWSSGVAQEGGNAGITLTPGVWMVWMQVSHTVGTDSAITLYAYGVGTSSGNTFAGAVNYTQDYRASYTPGGNQLFNSAIQYANVSTNTTYYPKIQVNGTRGNGTVNCSIYAVRIA